jgi:hypothetical protein
MRLGPSVIGWNAIVAYDRPKANKVLAQEYIERFSQSEGYMPKLTGAVPITASELEYVYDYLMDAPRLSFINSPITSSKALLTMKVLGGSQFTIVTELGRGAAVGKVAEYDALQAIPYEMDIDLMIATGSIDEGGKVVLDLHAGYGPLLYFGPTRKQREEGGKFMLNKLKSMNPVITTYVLNEMQSQEGQFLKVKYFDIKTHQEPGSTLAHAENYGEGEVLLFITMEGGTNGTYPANDNDLKFLIPQGDYSSTTVLGQRFLMAQIFAEGLKQIAAGSAFAYKLNGPVDGFISDVEITQGQYKGPPILSSSPSFAKIASSGFVLPLIKVTNSSHFQLSVVEDEQLQIDWSGSAEQECTVAPRGGSDIYGRVVASWKYSIKFQFDLAGEDGELNLTPLADSKFEQLKLSPGTFVDRPYGFPFNEIADDLEPRLSSELNACMDKFAAVVARVDAFRLNSLLFRGENIVRFTRSDFPGDLALFGQLAPQLDVFDISPLEYVIGQGGTHTFTTVPSKNVTWAVEKIEGYTGYAGQITSAGVYTAPVKSELEEWGLHFVRARIKATAGNAVAYALVTVVTRPISINPLVTTCNASTASLPQTREFAAGALAVGELDWRVAGNTGSSLAPSNNVPGGQTYTARQAETDLPTAYTLDEVVVTDSEGTSESSWVLVVHKQLLGEIKIEENPQLSPGQIQFVVASDEGNFEGVTWDLVKGGGEINSVTGVYTANQHDSSRFALITAYLNLPSPIPDLNCHYILPLPLVDLPVVVDMLDRSNIYFKAAAKLPMDEAAQLAGFNN